jgi:hypothetical protein
VVQDIKRDSGGAGEGEREVEDHGVVWLREHVSLVLVGKTSNRKKRGIPLRPGKVGRIVGGLRQERKREEVGPPEGRGKREGWAREERVAQVEGKVF